MRLPRDEEGGGVILRPLRRQARFAITRSAALFLAAATPGNVSYDGRRPLARRGDDEEIPRRARRRSSADAADLVDAPGGTLPSRISRNPRQRALVHRLLLHAGPCGRGDAAADPPLRLRCRDPVLRHSRHARRARAKRQLRERRGAAAEADRDGGGFFRAPRGARLVAPCARLRDGRARARRPAPGNRADRLLRRAVDGRKLHDRGPRHARSGPGPPLRLSRARAVFGADRPARGFFGRLSRAPDPRGRRGGADFRTPGPGCCLRKNSSAGA